MRAYYGTRFSNNMTRTPEGFLICHNVPIARTGKYEYIGNEIGLDSDDIITVLRDANEVFSSAAIASFEGKIATDEHPPELLTPENSSRYMKGTVQNVRPGTGKDGDLLLADMIFYDADIISEIEQGKREVSCGYECEYVPNEDGTYSQRQICGNHVAVVSKGRAGDRVAIKDSKPILKGEIEKMSKKLPRKQSGGVKDFLAAIGLKHFATDAEPEEIMDAVENLTNEKAEADGCGTKDEANPLAEIMAAIKTLGDRLTAVEAAMKPAAPEADPLDAMIGELEGKQDFNQTDEEESVTLPVEQIADEGLPDAEKTAPEDRPKPITNNDSMLRMLKVMKPIIANMGDKDLKKKAVDSLTAEFNRIKKGNGKNGYVDIAKTQKKVAADAAKKASEKLAMDADTKMQAQIKAYEDIKLKYNAQYAKGGTK